MSEKLLIAKSEPLWNTDKKIISLILGFFFFQAEDGIRDG